jgi:hypothetical protein
LSGLQRFNDLSWTNRRIIQRIKQVTTIGFTEFGKNEVNASAVTNGLTFNFV